MKFVMTQSLCAEGLALLDQAHVDYISADDGDPNHYPKLMQDADALIVRIGKCDAAALACCPQLKVIGRPGIGYDSVDVTQATKLGIPVVVTPGANGRSVAEHTVAMMLSLSKNLVEAITRPCRVTGAYGMHIKPSNGKAKLSALSVLVQSVAKPRRSAWASA